MSDYTDFTYLDYHNSEDGQRRVDPDAIGRAFSQAGASYYGDGSEFIVGYDANGGTMIDTDAVRAAARRKAEEAAESKRAEAAFQRILDQQRMKEVQKLYQQNAHTYLYHGRDIIWYQHNGAVCGHNLIHRDENCPYRFDSAKLGPVLSAEEGLLQLQGCSEMAHTVPCPHCFRPDGSVDAAISSRLISIESALKNGRWQKEFYTSATAPATSGSAPAAPARIERRGLKKFVIPAPGSITVDFYYVTIHPRQIVCQMKIVSPVELDTSAYLDVQSSLTLTCHQKVKPLFGAQDITVLTGEWGSKTGALLVHKSYQGEGYGYIMRLDYFASELRDRPKPGRYKIDLKLAGDCFARQDYGFQNEGFAVPTHEFSVLD